MHRVILAALLVGSSVAVAAANTFTVTNTNDSGNGSLRQAITDANNHAGADVIDFNISGAGVHTITPASQPPFITDKVTIDGTTQPGYADKPLIEISGATVHNSGGGNALVIQSGGDGSTIRALAVNNGWGSAILLQTSNVIIEACFLGTDATGTSASGNNIGVFLDFGFNISGTRIGDTTAAARNLISGNAVGVFIQNASNNVVEGNFIGTDVTGGNVIAQGAGVNLANGSNGNVIGGTTAAARNVIACNSGVFVGTGDGNIVEGNFIGTDVTGTKSFGFGAFSTGVTIDTGTNALIGGLTATPGAPPGNLIAGCGRGVSIGNNTITTVQGNLIGTDAAGTAVIGIDLDGVTVQGPSNTIGGSTTTARNVISGCGRHAVTMGTDNASVHDNFVQGNFIGTDINGVNPLPNGGSGIDLAVGFSNTIGGTTGTPGIPPGNVIMNNANGVIIGSGVTDHLIRGNVIAGNQGRGVFVAGANSTGNSILGNSIFGNGDLGIDLAGPNDSPSHVTPNDSGDADTGPNNLQNFPVLTSVANGGGMTTISGRINSVANKQYRIEFFSNDDIDGSGYGEGQNFIGFVNATTNGSGDASFSKSLSQIGAGKRVTATATDPTGNTSEFSGAIGQLLNVSTRMEVLTANSVLIGGFIVGGSGNIEILLRALGPTLGQLGVAGFLGDPILELHDGSGGLIMSNDNWKDSQQAAISATGKAPPDNAESAILHTFAPGNYTAIVRGKNQTTGVGLVEAYDLDEATGVTLTNISTRGFVETGNNVMIGGFISGNGIARVIVRALGPTLMAFNVPNVLDDPVLDVRDGQGNQLATNDNWADTQMAEIQASGFAPPNAKESAVIIVRPPGNTTAIVTGKNGTTGNALVEAYILPP